MRIEEAASINRFVGLRQMPTATPEAVLEELFQLLEAYGPTWYTQQHHDRAVAALFDHNW